MIYSKLTAKVALSLAIVFLLNGCASFGRGIGEALMKPQVADSGECRIFSSGFKGINSMFQENEGKLHVMMIHGIGDTKPGYAEGLAARLAYNQGLNIKGKNHKDIKLKSHTLKKDIGHLRIYYYASDDNRTKEMYFYEYTWASITAPIKEQLNYDISEANSENRTLLSKTMKTFINETGTDAVIYLGNKDASTHIKEGVAQSICWMTTETWLNLKDSETEGIACTIESSDRPRRKNYITITHSLGSQIVIDTLGGLASGEIGQDPATGMAPEYVRKYTIDTDIQIFMFANQLPAIAMGKERPAVTGKIPDYCGDNAKLKDGRMLKSMEVIAFSDPNDLLSYTLPPRFEERNLDSRLCPQISNIIVNVAHLSNLFGSQVANPFEAHSNYQKDNRIIDLIAKGTEDINRRISPKDGCYWLKEVNK